MTGGGFALVENAVLDDARLDLYDVAVYTALKSFCSDADSAGVWTCWPSVKTLCARARASRRRVFEVLKKLEALGFISRKARFDKNIRQSSRFTLHPQCTTCTPPSAPCALPPCTTCTPPVHGVHTEDTKEDTKEDIKEDIKEWTDVAATTPHPLFTDPLIEGLITEARKTFPEAALASMEKTLNLLRETHGDEALAREFRLWLIWCEANPKKKPKSNAARGLASWLARKKPRPAALSEEDKRLKIAAARVADQLIEAWPIPQTGRGTIEKTIFQRLKALSSEEDQNAFLESVQIEASTYLEEVKTRGTESKYIKNILTILRGVSENAS